MTELKEDGLAGLPADVLRKIFHVQLASFTDKDLKACAPGTWRLTQDPNSLHSFQALRSCSLRLMRLSNEVRPCISYPVTKREEVEAYLRKLPRLSAVTIHYGSDASNIHDSLTSLHSIAPELRSLSLHHHEKNRNSKAGIIASIDDLLLWRVTLQRLELESFSTANTGGSSLRFLAQLTTLRVLELNNVSPVLETRDVSRCCLLHSLVLRGNVSVPAIHLDVSSCVLLKLLICTDYSAQGLGVSGLCLLETLDCSKNSLHQLDVSTCSALTSLMCSRNLLESLSLTSCPQIEVVGCGFNIPLTRLLVTGCASLRVLTCDNCSITKLELSSCLALHSLHCKRLKAASLDVMACSNLHFLHADSSTEMLALNVAGLARLRCLTLSHSSLTSLDLSGCIELALLNCQSGPTLTSLCFLGCNSLQRLIANNSGLSCINLMNCVSLKSLNCNDCTQLELLDLSSCKRLKEIMCSGTGVRTLDVSAASSTLVTLHCARCPLEVLCADNCTWIVTLNCSSCPELRELQCKGCNSLYTFDCKGCVGLKELSLASLRAGKGYLCV